MRPAQRVGLLALVGILAVTLLAAVVSTLFWAWPAYTYRFGTAVTVTYDRADCTTTITRRGGGTASTSCPASWVVDGRRVSGTLTDNLGADLRPGPMPARAWGELARTSMSDQREYYPGLTGPPVLVAFGVLLLVGRLTGALRPVSKGSNTAEPAATGATGGTASATAPTPPDVPADVAQGARDRGLGPIEALHSAQVRLGWFVLALVLFVPLARGIFVGTMGIAELLPAGLGALALLIGVRRATTQRTWAVYVCGNGVWVRQRSDVFVHLWSEIDGLFSAVPAQPNQAGHRVTVTSGQETYAFEGRIWSDIAGLGARLEQHVNEALWPRVEAAFESGADVPFGPVRLSRQALSYDTTSLPWSQVRSVQVANGVLVVRSAAGEWSALVATVPCLPILLALANRARQAP